MTNYHILILGFTLLFFVTSTNIFSVYGFTDIEKRSIYEEGEHLFLKGHYHEALSMYEKILDEDPKYSDAVGAKAAVFHRLGD